MDKLLNKIYKNNEFINIIKDIITNETVQKMKNYRQHYDTNCFDHCLVAAYYCFLLCKKFNLDYISCSRAAMLHDLFLYDWREKTNERKGLHAFTHPKVAYENAKKLFSLNDKESDIILKHMWPVAISFPKYKESYILTLIDKYCALHEFFNGCNSMLCKKKFYRYAYIFLCVLFIKL